MKKIAETLSYTHDLRALAKIDDKVTFIEGALAHETVEIAYTRRKKNFDEAAVVQVIKPSVDRIEPQCPHFQSCGGCALQYMTPEKQIQLKEDSLREQLLSIGRAEPKQWLPPLVGSTWHYRNKARLSVRYVSKKGTTLIGFREKNNPRYIADIQTCYILHPAVGLHLSAFRAVLNALDDKESIAQIELAADDETVALIIRHLKALSQNDLEKLRLFAEQHAFKLYLQPSGPESVHLFYPESGESFLSYQIPVLHNGKERTIQYRFFPTDFTQINASINPKMVSLAHQLLNIQPEDVILDAFCGLGNFSLPLALDAKKVIGIEGSETMVHRAKENAALNHIHNVEFYTGNLFEPNTALTHALRQANKLLLDPPRSGGAELIRQLAKDSIKQIVYVSCNPSTLARDTAILVHELGYELLAAGVMDMFPHTAHVESIAVFKTAVELR